MLPPDQSCLLLCDLKDSTHLGAERGGELIRRIEHVLSDLNQRHASSIILPLEINYGDEFAGLLRDPAIAYEMVRAVRTAIGHQVRFRFAVVFGNIGARSGNIRQVGGEVFKTGNAAIRRLKRQNRFGEWHVFHDARDTELTLLTNLSQGFVARMTDYQFQIHSLMADGVSQKAIAEQLGKYPQSVSDAVRRAEIDLVIEAEAQILARLRTHDQSTGIDLETSIGSR